MDRVGDTWVARTWSSTTIALLPPGTGCLDGVSGPHSPILLGAILLVGAGGGGGCAPCDQGLKSN